MNNFDPTIPDQPVQHSFNPSLRGVTTGRTRPQGTTLHVQVEFGVNDKRYLPFDELEPLVSSQNGIEDLLESLKFGKVGDLARILTFHKISSNLSNVFYAMQASRTDFYSYQFKPVYKYIESLNNRILIADEVGLGKTIEAGLIWQETKARQAEARRLLIICPSMLRDKWKKELRERFDTRAEIYDTNGFLELLNEFQREGHSFPCAAVCSINTIRQDRIRTALEDLDESHRFDLVIIDEAHHMRNLETKSHRAGRLLADKTEAMVLLTATPIHLGSEDLFRLLQLLDTDEFSDFEIFRQRIEENEPIIRAQNYLRQNPPKIADALVETQLLESSPWFQESELLSLVNRQLKNLDPNNHSELIEVGRRLEKLNLFSSTISRTRKREVHENRVIRQSHSVNLNFNEQEKEFYQAVTQAVQQRIQGFAGSPVSGFALMMPQRMMASSIPAMVEYYREHQEIDEEVLDEIGFSFDEAEEANVSNVWLGLEQIISEWDLHRTDSKYEKLKEVLESRFQQEPEVKIIVFSFFKKTLGYLHRRLTQEGFTPLMIHGSIPMEERQEIIEKFKNEPSRRILLSSEVGSEGLDMQFCRIIINYDLPWNPMKVEQRIGRIDRIGQKAEKISILNFAVAGTIEEKILTRLYERIGIFERSLGDLEPILGELTEKLHNELLSSRLSIREEEERIVQTALAFETRRQHEEQLVEQSAVFLGASDYILQQIGRARELGRWITPKDLNGFTEDFFTNRYQGTTITWNKPAPGLVSLRLTNQALNDLQNFCQSQNPPLQTSLTYRGADTSVLAFDPTVAQDNQKLEMLTHFHPLIKWIADSHQKNENAFFPTAAVQLVSDLVPAGNYLIVVQFWTFQGVRRETQIAYAISPISESQNSSQKNTVSQTDTAIAEKLIQDIVGIGSNWQFADLSLQSAAVMQAWQECTLQLGTMNEESFLRFSQESEELQNRSHAHLKTFAERRNSSIEKAIETLREKLRFAYGEKERSRIESQIKGNQTRLANQSAAFQKRLAKMELDRRVQNTFTDIAAVVCQIKN